MTYAKLKQLKTSNFRRRCGVHRETFERMVEVLRPISTVEVNGADSAN